MYIYFSQYIHHYKYFPKDLNMHLKKKRQKAKYKSRKKKSQKEQELKNVKKYLDFVVILW